MAPQIDDLEGKLKFTEEEINNMQEALDKYNIQVTYWCRHSPYTHAECPISYIDYNLQAICKISEKYFSFPYFRKLEEFWPQKFQLTKPLYMLQFWP